MSEMIDSSVGEVLTDMMAQMFSKEALYGPVSAISEKFPQWLIDNKDTCEEQQYKQYEKQCECYLNLLKALNEIPYDNLAVMKLATAMQQFGAPPADLLASLGEF